MKITIDLEQHKNDEGNWNETIAKAVEQLTGKSFSEVVSEAEAETKPDIPEGNPASWKLKDKLKYLESHSKDDYRQLIEERK